MNNKSFAFSRDADRMASQEQIPCSLPDTQNTDALTQSQEVLSQEPTLVVWGRLCPKQITFRSLGRDRISLKNKNNTSNNEMYVSALKEILSLILQN